MPTSSWTKAVASPRELVLIDRGQNLVNGLLNQAVYHGGFLKGTSCHSLWGFLPFWLGSDGKNRPLRNVWAYLYGAWAMRATARMTSCQYHRSPCFQSLPYMPIKIGRTQNLLKEASLVEWYFHNVVFTHPHKSLHSPVPFGFRPISLRAVINFG